jgi:serine/threonine-protein kinase
MSSQLLFVDPYADTLELPVSGEFGALPPEWERDQVVQHLGGQYQVVRELGRGGMGVVFLARDIALHRLVAIKVLRYEFASSFEHRERFRREARMTARLNHSNIVPLHSFGEVDDFVYIVMKYVHGLSLAERLRREEKLPAKDVRRILRHLALALDSAHGDGVVHRDLKPENILLDASTNQAMLTDFGVALLKSLDPVRAEAAVAIGTPHYMSPEQAAGDLDIDGRSDVYALGVLGYRMLTGRLPFEANSFEAIAAKHIAEPAPAIEDSSDSGLIAIIERCMAKTREDRFKTGAELAEAIDTTATRKRWFKRASNGANWVARNQVAVYLALAAAAARHVFRWTMI